MKLKTLGILAKSTNIFVCVVLIIWALRGMKNERSFLSSFWLSLLFLLKLAVFSLSLANAEQLSLALFSLSKAVEHS